MLRWYLSLSPHMRIAIIMAPFLAIGGYGLADLWESKKAPEVKKDVAMQQLFVEGQCKLSAGKCTLSYNNLKVVIRQGKASEPGLARLELEPSVVLRAVQMSLVQDGEEHKVLVDRRPEEDVWIAEFPVRLLQPSPDILRIAIAQAGKLSFAEVEAPF